MAEENKQVEATEVVADVAGKEEAAKQAEEVTSEAKVQQPETKQEVEVPKPVTAAETPVEPVKGANVYYFSNDKYYCVPIITPYELPNVYPITTDAPSKDLKNPKYDWGLMKWGEGDAKNLQAQIAKVEDSVKALTTSQASNLQINTKMQVSLDALQAVIAKQTQLLTQLSTQQAGVEAKATESKSEEQA